MPSRLVLGPTRSIDVGLTGARPHGRTPAQAMAALRDVSARLSSAGIDHWLTYGALLGLVREGRLLEHDTDLDFALVGDIGLRDLEDLLQPAGFSAMQLSSVGGRPALAKFRRGPVGLDLFLLRDGGDLYIEDYPFDRHSYCSGTHLKTAVRAMQVDGFAVPVPTDTERYLEHLYGPQWRTPVTQWDWLLSPPNTTVHLHWRSLHKIVRRWLYARTGL